MQCHMKLTSFRISFIQSRQIEICWLLTFMLCPRCGGSFRTRKMSVSGAARVLVLASGILISGLFSSFAADPGAVVASLKSPSTVTRSNGKTGSYLGSISVSNAISVGCDGTTIAVLSANGSVNRYDARTGSYQGSISAGAKTTSVQVTGGVIIVQKDRTLNRYDAKSGSYLGSTSL